MEVGWLRYVALQANYPNLEYDEFDTSSASEPSIRGYS